MPWTALAPAGISTPGSASQVVASTGVPEASITPTCAVTIRLVRTSIPVVSRSKTASSSNQRRATGSGAATEPSARPNEGSRATAEA
ncbi:hypothetical protein Q0F99_17560 [Rathayibacter oskolensis]|uniref:hypothetical protein n=1 Tax=Rathayibacter oskolensis TaxID=1891671 RepID=UPI00265F4067|nr:hypothetical protein [Rathayibacter oskolensis]WKK73429.1 hypothetical protein Q0F99_17560 [Rathayibacter oskolensis]